MSYLRLKNVTVGYTLPKEWTRKAYIEKARIYFSGSNLFCSTKGNDLPVDPEISTGNGLIWWMGTYSSYYTHILIWSPGNITCNPQKRTMKKLFIYGVTALGC